MFSNVMWSNLDLILSRYYLFQYISGVHSQKLNDHYNAEHQLL